MKSKIIFYLFFLLLLPSLLAAQRTKIEAIGFSAGTVLPEKNWDPGFAFEGQVDMGEILDYVFLIPTVSYWQSQKNDSYGDFSETITRRHINFGAKVVGYINPKPQGLFAGIAVQYHYILSESLTPLTVSNLAEVQEMDHTRLGLGALLGYCLKLRKASFFLESRYVFIKGGYNTAQLSAGMFYLL